MWGSGEGKFFIVLATKIVHPHVRYLQSKFTISNSNRQFTGQIPNMTVIIFLPSLLKRRGGGVVEAVVGGCFWAVVLGV